MSEYKATYINATKVEKAYYTHTGAGSVVADVPMLFQDGVKLFDSTPANIDVTQVNMSPALYTPKIAVGGTLNLKITIQPAEATNKNVIVSFAGTGRFEQVSYTPSVSGGELVVKRVSTGQAQITVTSESNPDKSATCFVTST